jgi:type IV pilus assembly protein PilE
MKGISKRKAIVMRSQGFSLLELMITVAIVAILATIAYASYQAQIVKSRRAAGASCLQERAQFMERFYTTTLTYEGAPAPPACDAEVASYYTISFVAAPTARAFTLQAAPQGIQATRDTKCATLTINQQGLRTVSGTGTEADCW